MKPDYVYIQECVALEIWEQNHNAKDDKLTKIHARQRDKERHMMTAY